MSTHVLRLSGFMIMGFLAMTLAQVIEAFYLGMVGADELAAVAFTFPVVMSFSAMTRGIGVGTGAVLARAIGEGDRPQARRLASHGMLLTGLFTALCALLLAWQGEGLFGLLGARGHILELTTAYMVIWCVGFPAFGMSMVGSGLMRSIGDPAFPGWVMTTGSVVQVLVAPPLIFGWLGLPALGIEGAAWSFVIARSTSFCMTAWWFLMREKMFRLDFVDFMASSRAIAHVGVPAAASNLIQPLSAAVTTRILAGFGATVVAGFGVASRLESVVTMVVIGISASVAPLVGQNWGAQRYDRVREALTLGYRYSLVWGLIATVIMWVGAPFFVSLINDDPMLTETAVTFLYILPISIGFFGMVNVANASFNALSKPAPPLILSVSRLVIVYIPLAIVAARFYGYQGVFVVTAAVTILFGLVGRWWNNRTIARLTPARASTS
jgi:putative MATE family efflux protein